MKTSTKTTTPSTEKCTIKILMLGRKTAEITFSDPSQAHQMFDILRTLGVFGNTSIRTITLE
jgi:hypothetical protein